MAQIGLTFARDPYDVARYARLREIAAEMMAVRGALGREVLIDLFSSERGYATPKVDVRGVVFRDGRLLLVRETDDGGWSLPGGWADVNESPRESVVRELREESGYEVRPVK